MYLTNIPMSLVASYEVIQWFETAKEDRVGNNIQYISTYLINVF